MYRSSFIVFILAFFMLLEVQGQWLDYLCKNKEEAEMKYNGSALVLLPAKFKDHENSTWQYRKLCLYDEEEVGKCTDVKVIMNGTEHVGTADIREEGAKFPLKTAIKNDSSINETSHVKSRKMNRRDTVYARHFVPKTIRIRRASQGTAADLPNYYFGESSCKPPTNLKTTEVLCKIFPSSIKCKSFCVYGFTFDEGIERQHSCIYKENKWSKEFGECRPFVDCSLKLVSPGKLKCIGNEIMKSPQCTVNCDEYEDKAEVNTQVYACLADGSWQPPLPHCVQLKGTNLARAPAKREHDAITYP